MEPFFRAVFLASGLMAAFVLALLAGEVAARSSQFDGRARKSLSTVVTVGVFVSIVFIGHTFTVK